MRYILGVFGVIVLLIFIVILIVRRDPTPSTTTQTGKKQVLLADYESKPATASLTTRGEVTADEERRAIRISVSAQERVIEILEGYNETVVNRQSFANNENAYKIFLSALDTAGFTRGQETEIKDERGFCPLGRRFVYRLQDGSEQVLRTWNTTCAEKQGSFGGNGRTIRRLFEQQIPDYRRLVRDVKL
jgi:hypothetical protein